MRVCFDGSTTCISTRSWLIYFQFLQTYGHLVTCCIATTSCTVIANMKWSKDNGCVQDVSNHLVRIRTMIMRYLEMKFSSQQKQNWYMSETLRIAGKYRNVHLPFAKGNGKTMPKSKTFDYAHCWILRCNIMIYITNQYKLLRNDTIFQR